MFEILKFLKFLIFFKCVRNFKFKKIKNSVNVWVNPSVGNAIISKNNSSRYLRYGSYGRY
jgi:hypothetical protein